MTDPTSRASRRGRHTSESGGRSAAELLASYRTGDLAPVRDDQPTGPVTERRHRRSDAGAAVPAPVGGAMTSAMPAGRPSVPNGRRDERAGDARAWDDEAPTDRHDPVPSAAARHDDHGHDPARDGAGNDPGHHPGHEPGHDADHDRQHGDRHELDHDAHPDAHPDDETAVVHPHWDETGGLEVIAGDPVEKPRRGRGRGADDHHPDDHHPDDHHDDDERRPRRRRRPVAVLLSLLVLGALVAGIVVGGQWLIGRVNPEAQDFTGQGAGEVEVRISSGDSLTAIAGTLVEADVIASEEPFTDAASANVAATGIQPGVYGMRLQMSGQAALDRLLDPASRLFSRVTVPEGQRVEQVLQRLADGTDTPLEELTAAAADTASLGLPAWAGGTLEGLLFPSTYDFEPGTPPADMLRTMVTETVQTLDRLGVPEDQRLAVLTKASLVQAEAGSVEDMGMVSRVIDNRLADGMPLQFDTTVNYANGKTGITTTPEDRANPSPYNTYVYPGLPPGAINNPGEDAIAAALAPTPGDWRFFVVTDPDTGETRFAVTAEEHAANVEVFRQWLRENPGG